MHKSLVRFGGTLAAVVSLALTACSGTSSFGTPASGPVQPQAPQGPANPAQPAQAQGGRAVADTQSVDAVATWYFTHESGTSSDDKFKKRLDRREAFDAAHPVIVAAAPNSGTALAVEVKGTLPKDAPDSAIYALSVPAFPSDESGAEQLAKPYGVERNHQVVDPKNPEAPPQDVIRIAKGPLTWTIDRLTGAVSFVKTHNDGVLPIDVKTAQVAAEAFVRDHGGMPDDAALGDPTYDLSKGDSVGAPKPRRITFVWHHKGKDVFGNDQISVDVTMDATAGGSLPGVAVAPPAAPTAPPAPGAPVAAATPVPAATSLGWGVTSMSRLWRTRGKEVDKASSLLTADAAIEKLKAATLPGIDASKPATVADVTFGEFREPENVVQTKTRPVWGMSVNGKHFDVDARTGEVLVTTAPPPSPNPTPKGKSASSSASSAPPAPSASGSAQPALSPEGGAPSAAAPANASAAPSVAPSAKT